MKTILPKGSIQYMTDRQRGHLAGILLAQLIVVAPVGCPLHHLYDSQLAFLRPPSPIARNGKKPSHEPAR